MANWEKSLKKMVGDKGYETLRKAIYRKDSDSEIGPLDIYLPLLVVPRAIISWLYQNIKDIPSGEERQLVFPGLEDITIKIQKTGRDSYRADFVKDGKVIHQFDKQTLPNVGGHLMTIGEMYDFQDEEHKEAEESPDIAVPKKMINLIGGIQAPTGDDGLKWESISTLTSAIGKLVDALVCNQVVRTNVENAMSTSLDKEQKTEAPKSKVNENVKRYNETEIRHIKKPIEKSGAQEGPSGQAVPDKPDFIKPVKPSREQKPLKLIKPLTNKDYFKNKLNKCKKTEKKEYRVLEKELYTSCPHCGVPEFQKTESGPKYKPCACFYVTLKTEEGKATSFVRVLRKSEGTYSLVFNKNADQETVSTFLMTLKNKLIKQKDNM